MTFVVRDRVRDTTTTTGTGVVTVSGTAPVAYQTFSAVLSTNDTFPGFIAHQTANEWEVGTYTYSGVNQITRTQVLASSNAGSAVSFSSGTKDVVLSEPGRNAYAREILQAARTYYVRTDGSDSNDGLTNTAGGAFLTLGHAWDIVCLDLDLSGQDVTIQIGAGSYSNTTLSRAPIGGTPTITGDTTTPSNVVFEAILASGVGASANIQGLKFTNATNDHGFNAAGAGQKFSITGKMDWGSIGTGNHVRAENGAVINLFSNSNVTGSAQVHMQGLAGGIIFGINYTETYSGTPAFTYNMYANTGSLISMFGYTFTGAATGQRYNVSGVSIINSFGGGASYFNGNSAGFADATTFGAYS